MTEVTSIFLTIMFSVTGTTIGFIFGWFCNSYINAFLESRLEENIHPEMIDNQGYFVNEELLAVRFVDEDELSEDDED